MQILKPLIEANCREGRENEKKKGLKEGKQIQQLSFEKYLRIINVAIENLEKRRAES